MKKTVRILALVLVLVLLTGCGDKTKEFTCDGMTITVPSYMFDASSDSAYSAFTFALDSAKIAIFGLRESYAEYPALEGYSLADYTDLVIDANGLDCPGIERSTADYLYFEYTAQLESGMGKYLVGCFQDEDGFWMIQVCSEATDYDQEAFLSYLDSVSFS